MVTLCDAARRIDYSFKNSLTFILTIMTVPASLLQVLMCEYLANQPGEQITFVSCHPGWTDTPGVEFAYGSQKLVGKSCCHADK